MRRRRRVPDAPGAPDPVGRGGGRDRDAGFALVEVLVAALLLALVAAALLPLLTAGTEGSAYAQRRADMARNGRVALDKLLREARAAESFRVLAPGQVSFTLDWGDGTGASPTVQYTLNPATHNLEYRWSADYDYRVPITVRAQNAVGAGYAVAVQLNHASLVAAGKSLASGDDVRVRYWNGSAYSELDRVLDPTSAWNTSSTTLWFALQAPIAAGATDANYFLYYGNLADSNPPAFGPNVFLDYQDGTSLDGWVRRDGLLGAVASSPTDGFVFQAASGSGWRELTKNEPHGDVEIFWGFWNGTTDAANGNQAGVSARLGDTGAGYRLVPGDRTDTLLSLYYAPAWGGPGSVIASVPGGVVPGVSYFGRFAVVGGLLQAKYWAAGTAEPSVWQLAVIDGRASAGNHYGQFDGAAPSIDHRHRTLIIRSRVALEPAAALGAETAGGRADASAPLAGPFRTLVVSCFDASGGALPCAPSGPVQTVQIQLVVMDADGLVPDLSLTGQAARRAR
jgi:type II secretory pathway pseudopilin PulG